MNTLDDCLGYLNQLNPAEIDLGLSRIFKVAGPLPLLNFSCPVITVAGTNGKGSVVKLLETIFHLSGYQVGAYTSPHILRFNERIRFNNVEISDEELRESLLFIEKNRGNIPLSFFEFTTMAAFHFYQKKQPDVLILEVGLGGRLDAVNSVDPDISVITSIDFDHMDWLGTTRDEIGFEKAGIARSKKPLVFMDKTIPDSVEQYAQEIGAELIRAQAPASPTASPSSRDSFAGSIFTWKMDSAARPRDEGGARRDVGECSTFSPTWSWKGKTTEFSNLPLPHLKLQNVAGALMVIELLQKRLPVSSSAIREGVKTARVEGRFEYSKIQGLVFDVAHNPASAAWLAEQVKRKHPEGRKFAVFSMLKDKDIAACILPFIDLIDVWLVPDLDVARAESSQKIGEILSTQGLKKWYTFPAVSGALSCALKEYNALRDLIIVFGSFHTVERAKKYLNGVNPNGS